MNTPIIDISNEGVIYMLVKLDSFESITSTSYEGYGASLLRPSPTSRIFENYWRETKESKMQIPVQPTKGDSYNSKLSKDIEDCILDDVINIYTDKIYQYSNNYPNNPAKQQ